MTDARDGGDPNAGMALALALLFGLVFWASLVRLVFF